MRLDQFNDLVEVEQYEEVWEYGVLVGYRIESAYKIILYEVFTFYIELYYHTEHNALKLFRSYSSIECLDSYLNQFDLTEIDCISKRQF